MTRFIVSVIAACVLFYVNVVGAMAFALTPEQALALSSGDTDARIAALQKALASPNDKTAAFLQALSNDEVKVSGARVFVVRDGQAVDAATGNNEALPDTAEDVINNNRMRG